MRCWWCLIMSKDFSWFHTLGSFSGRRKTKSGLWWETEKRHCHTRVSEDGGKRQRAHPDSRVESFQLFEHFRKLLSCKMQLESELELNFNKSFNSQTRDKCLGRKKHWNMEQQLHFTPFLLQHKDSIWTNTKQIKLSLNLSFYCDSFPFRK